MAIALLGATGRTGRLVLQVARRRGWPVRSLVRDPARLPAAAGIAVAAGDARDEAAVDAVMHGPGGRSGAVLCALGMDDFRLPATDFSDSVKAVIAAMRQRAVRRIVAIASSGVLDHPQGGLRRDHALPAALRHVSDEHLRVYEALRDSGLDWTLMCPPDLTDDIPAGRARWQYDTLPEGSREAGRADLARLMCDLLTERASVKKRVGIVSLRPAGEAAR